jgi:alpha-ketoglutarate-dependent taurine dioxygenase
MKLLCDGWCAEYDVDLKSMPDDELQDLFKDIYKYQVLNFKKQDLAPADMLRIAELVGTVQKQKEEDKNRPHGGGNEIWEYEGILRVGGDNLTGKHSLFSHKHALDWHANQPSNPNRKELIWLYAVTGVEGSRTSWINNVHAYNDLPEDVKQTLEDVYVYCGYQTGRYSDSPLFKDHVDRSNPVKLVRTFGEHKGLFFPFYQIFEVVGWPEQEGRELIEYLQNHILQEKYMWHLDWEQGDLNIAEQVLTIHKRWDFEGMGERILWRIASGHEYL